MNNERKAEHQAHQKTTIKENRKSLTMEEASDYLQISKSHLYKFTYTKRISHYKPGGKIIYFFKNELDEWIAENKIQIGGVGV